MKPNFEGFANDMLEIFCNGNDADGADIQDLAKKHGLISTATMYKPCCDNCRCAEWGDFPLTCYRKTY